jgi:hypothetical protein
MPRHDAPSRDAIAARRRATPTTRTRVSFAAPIDPFTRVCFVVALHASRRLYLTGYSEQSSACHAR